MLKILGATFQNLFAQATVS